MPSSVRSAAPTCPAPRRGVRVPSAARVAAAALVAVVAAVAVQPAEAGHRHGSRHHGWRSSVVVSVGPVWYRPWPVYAPLGYGYVYAAPPVVVTAPGPTVWIERADLSPSPPAGFWYWCDASNAYWPSVQSCPSPWVPVAPRAEAGTPTN